MQSAAFIITGRRVVLTLVSLLFVVGSLKFKCEPSIFSSRRTSLSMSSRSGMKASPSKSPSEIFFCDQCGVEHIKWVGRCTSCKEWNTVKPFKAAKLSTVGLDPRLMRSTPSLSAIKGLVPGSSITEHPSRNAQSSWLGNRAGSSSSMIPMEDVELNITTYRLNLFSDEMNRVLGGGLVRGSVSLLAGDPGIGKSTLLMQIASTLANDKNFSGRSVVYISGEENPEQLAARSKRLGMSARGTFLICDIDVDNAMDSILSMPSLPCLVIVDSVQTMRTAACNNGMGSVTQIRESAARFVELAKSSGIAVLLIGHVTKSGDIAGPRVLEHMVDVVLYLEGSERSEYRLLRGVKNRFGSTAEVGVFLMSPEGMVDVPNPSELFMSSSIVSVGAEGSAAAVIMEGTRPLLAEIQCLVGAPAINTLNMKVSPRRAADGFPLQRLQLICAVIEKRLKLSLWNRDVYLNVVGGLRISEPASDLAVAVTIASSLAGMKIMAGIAFIGEIGLAGEIRGVRNVDMRISEAQKLGFTTIVIPNVKSKFPNPGSKVPKTSEKNVKNEISNNRGKNFESGLGVISCSTLIEVLVIALEVKSFDEILDRLKSGSRKKKKTVYENVGKSVSSVLPFHERELERRNGDTEGDSDDDDYDYDYDYEGNDDENEEDNYDEGKSEREEVRERVQSEYDDYLR